MWENKMIRYADIQDFSVLKEHDKHISEAELRNIIPAKRIFVMHQGDTFMGWLRFGLFWDNIPFMNMLYILDGYRGKGYGTKLVSFWEKEMAKVGYNCVLTSTQSNERAQFFIEKSVIPNAARFYYRKSRWKCSLSKIYRNNSRLTESGSERKIGI